MVCMEPPLGYVTSDKWSVEQLDGMPAVWVMAAGIEPMWEGHGCTLRASEWGDGMLVFVKWSNGRELPLMQSQLDSAQIDAGIFRFGAS